jgi:hypothetical protein
MRLRSLAASLIAALAVSGLATVSTPTAATAEDDGPFDVYALRSPGLAVSSGSCRYVGFTARSTADASFESVEAEVDIWNGGSHLGSVSLASVAGDPTRLTGRYYYCPYEGTGIMRLGPSQVSYWDWDYNSGDYVDTSRGTVDIRQATRSPLEVRRTGQLRKFIGRPKYFAGEWASEWTRFPKGTLVKLQRRPANGTGTWRTVLGGRVDRTGKVVISTRASKRFQYRLVHPGTKNSRPLRSRVVTS